MLPAGAEGLVWLAEDAAPSTSFNRVISFGEASLDETVPFHGIPTGTVHEWYSGHHLPPLSFFAFVARQVVQAHCKRVVWVDPSVWPTPHFLCDLDPTEALLEQSTFIEPTSNRTKLWIVDQALRTPGVGFIAAPLTGQIKSSLLKRFALLAKDSGAILFLFREPKYAALPSPVSARWKVNPAQGADDAVGFRLELLKIKGPNTGHTCWEVFFEGRHISAVPLEKTHQRTEREAQQPTYHAALR